MRAGAPSPEMSTALPALRDATWLRPDVRRERDDDPSQRLAETLDRALNYALSRATLGLSPAAVAEAYFDWMVHLAAAPGKQLQLTQEALRKTLRFWHYAATCALRERPGSVCIEPLPNDKRFSADAWRAWPFNAIHQAFLLQQEWWHNATTGVRGVSAQHERQVEFATRQVLDVFSPANFVLTNPEVLRQTQAGAGQNLVRGFWNFVEDWERNLNGRKPVGAEGLKVGENLGLSAGKVIFRNRLIELIQYTPATDKVRPEPMLIVPAWIMKYYILDLTPEKSLVKYLVEQGFNVFMISWKNPDPEDRDLSLIALTDIRAPVFAVGTETDHVAPWRSVFKLHLLLDTDVTFLLTSGGHNAGIVSEPGRSGRRYRQRAKSEKDYYLDPDAWLRDTLVQQGSWWPAWTRWLVERSSMPAIPPVIGGPGLAPLADAPGTYVLEP